MKKLGKNILGISAFYHDSGAALLQDGKIIAAGQEERFTRKKQDSSFPIEAVKYCLKEGAIDIDDLDAIVFYDKPLLKFERLLETYYAFAPRGLKSFLSAIPVWIKEKLFLEKLIFDELKKVGDYDKKKLKLLFSDHHLSHAGSAYYPSPFKEAAILTIDGVGEWATASMSQGTGKDIRMIKELRFPHSLGLLYSAFTYFLGFKVNSGEYKLMGLAPYGNHNSDRVEKFKELILEHLIDLRDDGSLHLDQNYFNYATGLKMVDEKKWADIFGFPKRTAESELKQIHCDLGLAIQQVTEEVVLRMAKEIKKITGSENLCLAGGVALNCVANGKILKEKIFKNVWIQPAAGDAGGALGAAYNIFHMYFNNERKASNKNDAMQGSYLGPKFYAHQIRLMAKKQDAPYTHYKNFDEVAKITAKYIAEGKIIGWHQGRMEWGPRALGNRSILGDARNKDMQKRLNLKIKYRESFRPFAPSVLAEDSKEYFDLEEDSPYMLIVAPVQESRCKERPTDYEKLNLKERLYHIRSDIPSITHLDHSARIQTVHRDTNKRYWELIKAFKDLTGYSLVVNTSFNVRGEPIVCSPEDSYRCFMRTEMDYLVVGNFIFDKKIQKEIYDKEDWTKEYPLD